MPSTRGVEHVGDAQARLRIERDVPQRLELLAHGVDRRCGGSRAARAGTSPCRRSPARCSGRAAGSRRRRRGRCCRSPSRGWRWPSPWSSPGCARSRPGRSRSRRCRRWRRAARRRAAPARATPVTACHRLRGCCAPRRRTRAQSSNSLQSQRSRDVGLVDQAFGDDDMRQRVEHRDVGAGPQRQVMIGLDVRRLRPDRCGADRPRSASRPGAAASSCARRTPDARRSDWRRSP